MSRSQCQRMWEVEAAHDGRLIEAARQQFELHAQHCDACAREQAKLVHLAGRLRRVVPDARDELVLRRERQRLLEVVDARAVSAADSGARPSRARWIWFAPLALGLAALLLVSRNTRKPAAMAVAAPPEQTNLMLTAAPGTRFEHERRPEIDFVSLQEGKLSIAFRRGSHRDLVVRVPDGEIRDLGTVFDVVVTDTHTREIVVRDGAVVFRRAGEEDVIVLAGESFERNDPDPPAAISGKSARPELVRAVRRASARARAPKKREQSLAAPKENASEAAQDSAYLHIVSLIEGGRLSEARRAARAYVHDFPSGYRRREVEQIADAE